jgi:hypothetical protein
MSESQPTRIAAASVGSALNERSDCTPMDHRANSSLCLPEGGIDNSPGWTRSEAKGEPWVGDAFAHAPRRAARRSAPNVSRIVINALFLQKRNKLGLEIALPMVFLLPRDVGERRCHLGRTYRERSIPLLPLEFPTLALFVKPPRRRTLDLTHRLSNRHGRRQRQQNMNVILGPAHRQSLHAVLARNAAHVGPQSWLDIGCDRPSPLPGGEDTMEQRATIGV